MLSNVFDIKTVPYYHAEYLFENKQYQEAFELFLICAHHGNLYAPFYIRSLLDKGLAKVTRPEIDVKEIMERIPYIPTEHKPNYRCQASSLIVRINDLTEEDLKIAKEVKAGKAGKSPNAKKIKKLLLELEPLQCEAQNASVFLIEYHRQNQTLTVAVFGKYQKHLQDSINAYSLYHLNEYRNAKLPDIKIVWSETLETQWKTLQRFLPCANRADGLLETLVSKSTDSPKYKYHWQKSAAHLGSAPIHFIFSQPSINKTEKKLEEMSLWLYMAAISNEVRAQMLAGLDFRRGDKKPLGQNLYLARKMFEKAIKNRDKASAFPEVFGQVLASLANMTMEKQAGLVADPARAFEYYKEASALGDFLGHAGAADGYYEGWDGKKNHQLALEHNEKALKVEPIPFPLLVPKIHRAQGLIYLYGGHGVECDYECALYHFQKASSNDDVALTKYAEMLYDGLGTQPNQTAAIKLLIEGSKKKFDSAILSLARLYVFRYINNPETFGLSNEFFIPLLKPLVLRNVKDAAHYLGVIHARMGNPKAAFEYFQETDSSGNDISAFELGIFYEHGCDEIDLKQNYETAYCYYEKAINAGSTTAMNNKASLLLKGFGVDKDVDAAKILFERALAAGSKMAAYNLSKIYLLGLGSTPKDIKQAFEYIKQAESTEDEDVLHDLGAYYAGLYSKGEKPPVAIDTKIALSYFERAAAKGHCAAANYCADIKFRRMVFETHYLTNAGLDECIAHLSLPVKEGYAIAKFLTILFNLLKNPRLIKESIDGLERMNAEKPYKPARTAMNILQEYLDAKITVIPDIAIFCFIYQQDITEKKQIDKLIGKEQPQANDASIVPASKIASPSLAAKPNPAAAAEPPEKSATQSSLEKVQSALANFIDQPLKGIQFKELNRIFGQISEIPGLKLDVELERGKKGYRYKANIENKEGKPVFFDFSYHPTHRRGSKIDGDLDRGRRHSLRGIGQQLAEALLPTISNR